MQALTVFVRSGLAGVVLLAAQVTALAQPAPPDPLARVRQLYNAGMYDDAIAAAAEVASRPGVQNEARLLLGRALLERHRTNRVAEDLDSARTALRGVEAASLGDRGRIDLVVGLGEALYLDADYRPAASLLEPVLEQMDVLSHAEREQVLDWWATAMDRYAQTRPPDERVEVYADVEARLRAHLGRHPDSSAASYWLPASALARGDLELAWDLAIAAWVRSTLAPDDGVQLRTDIDRLVTQAIIPERVKRLPDDPDAGAAARFTAEWDEAKLRWK